jgi:hypothetical protein
MLERGEPFDKLSTMYSGKSIRIYNAVETVNLGFMNGFEKFDPHLKRVDMQTLVAIYFFVEIVAAQIQKIVILGELF